MKYYKLMTNFGQYKVGTIFNFKAKHFLMSQLSFKDQRTILWENASREEAMANSYNYTLNNQIVTFNDNEFYKKHLH